MLDFLVDIPRSSGGHSITNAYCAQLQVCAWFSLSNAMHLPGHGISSGSVSLGCDNLGIIQQLSCSQEVIPASTKNADLIWTNHALLRQIPCRFNFHMCLAIKITRQTIHPCHILHSSTLLLMGWQKLTSSWPSSIASQANLSLGWLANCGLGTLASW